MILIYYYKNLFEAVQNVFKLCFVYTVYKKQDKLVFTI